MNIKEEIIEIIAETIKKVFAINKDLQEIIALIKISIPPNPEMGDFALECFPFAKLLGLAPVAIAEKITENLSGKLFSEVKNIGPYVNIKLDNKEYFNRVLGNLAVAIDKQKSTGQKVTVEYLSPNTNKPLHLGHVRNGCLGSSIANIQSHIGNETVKLNLVNDRGVHICKSMLAWQKFGNGETPESTGLKGDHFVGKYYVRFAQESDKNPALNDEAQAMLKKWEDGDKEVLELWQKMNAWVYAGFEKTYLDLGFRFDKIYFESNTYKLGKNIVQEGLEKGVFKKDENDLIYYILPESEFGLDQDNKEKKVVVTRGDGTTVYITQDMGTAVERFKDYNFNESIYVVGSEQRYHFKCLISILSALGYDWAKSIRHFAYGMVYLPEGKMKSREGKVVDADNFFKEMLDMAKQAIQEKHDDLNSEEVERRAHIIALGAIKFYILRVGAEQDIHFDPKESISFTGFTGPYCQYAFARISGILKKAEEEDIKYDGADLSLLGNTEEKILLQKILLFQEKVKESAVSLSPSTLALHVYETAKAFNQFYHQHKVLNAETPELVKSRLMLSGSVAQMIKKGLELLGIEVLENM